MWVLSITLRLTSVYLCPTVPHRVLLCTPVSYTTSRVPLYTCVLHYLTGYLCTPVSYTTSQGTSVHLCPYSTSPGTPLYTCVLHYLTGYLCTPVSYSTSLVLLSAFTYRSVIVNCMKTASSDVRDRTTIQLAGIWTL